MKRISLMVGMVLAIGGVSSVLAAGGVLPNGLGTNWSYGQLYGQGSYVLQEWQTHDVNGSGITNLDGGQILTGNISTNALTNALSVSGADIGGNISTNALTNALSVAGSMIGGNISTNALTNALENWSFSVTNITTDLTIGSNVVYVPTAVRTIAAGDTIVADTYIVKVIGDGGAVSAAIGDGGADGQVLKIIGTDADNTVQLTNACVNPSFALGTNDVIQFQWISGSWLEDYRRDN